MPQEPASIRFKNPGAMWGSALAIKWGAKKKAITLKDGKGQGNNIAVFPTYVQGICAQLDLWRTSKNYRNKKFEDAILIWSGHNEVESYITFVLKRVPGMTRKTVMDDAFWNSPQGIAFLKAQAWHEAGKKYPAPDADWIEARKRVFDGVPAVQPEPEPPAKVQPPIGQQNGSIYAIQQRLDARGYHEVGMIDGKWGSKTAAAIAAFKSDRHVDGEPVIDLVLRSALDAAEKENWQRPIAKEREEATEATVAKNAPEIVPIQRGRFAAFWGFIGTIFLGALNAVADYFHDAMSWVVGLKQYAADAPAYVWLGLAAAVAFAMYFAASRGASGIVEAFRKGERS